ncbi:hypothetical protein AB8B21_05535 [Tardiphaga sp. 866_E4_N2_1]|uniref:hypothetical protein n=1 Tax=unclassified Tardiphaga TaxID=2631404 RepID=UPI003F2917A6
MAKAEVGKNEPSTPVAPIVLVKASDPDQKPVLFACGKCGHLYSPRIYACKEEIALQTARDAATDCYNCKTHSSCQHCGAQCEKLWTACEACRRAKRLASAKQVPHGEIEECFGFDGGEFYRSPVDAADDGEDWVYASTFRTFSIDGERLDESILDDHHEDASIDDLVGHAELWAAIEKFNAAQTSGSFDQDQFRIANVAKLRDPQNHDAAAAGAA